MKSILLANIVHYIHLLVVLFILSGVFYLPEYYLPFYITFIIITILGWNNSIGACYLTTIEHYFRTGEWSTLSATDNNGPEFFRPFITSITGINMTRDQSDRLNYIAFMLVAIAASIKYLLYLKSNK
jgi:hypothetical protein